MGHGAWGMGRGAWGVARGAWGMGMRMEMEMRMAWALHRAASELHECQGVAAILLVAFMGCTCMTNRGGTV